MNLSHFCNSTDVFQDAFSWGTNKDLCSLTLGSCVKSADWIETAAMSCLFIVWTDRRRSVSVLTEAETNSKLKNYAGPRLKHMWPLSITAVLSLTWVNSDPSNRVSESHLTPSSTNQPIDPRSIYKMTSIPAPQKPKRRTHSKLKNHSQHLCQISQTNTQKS